MQRLNKPFAFFAKISYLLIENEKEVVTMITIISVLFFCAIFGVVGFLLLGSIALVIDLVVALLPYILVIAAVVAVSKLIKNIKKKKEDE